MERDLIAVLVVFLVLGLVAKFYWRHLTRVWFRKRVDAGGGASSGD